VYVCGRLMCLRRCAASAEVGPCTPSLPAQLAAPLPAPALFPPSSRSCLQARPRAPALPTLPPSIGTATCWCLAGAAWRTATLSWRCWTWPPCSGASQRLGGPCPLPAQVGAFVWGALAGGSQGRLCRQQTGVFGRCSA
jgi:hypothetical protein